MNKQQQATAEKEKNMAAMLEFIKSSRDGRTAREIASKFGMPISTVRTYLGYLKSSANVKCIKTDGLKSMWTIITPIDKKEMKLSPHKIALLANQAY